MTLDLSSFYADGLLEAEKEEEEEEEEEDSEEKSQEGSRSSGGGGGGGGGGGLLLTLLSTSLGVTNGGGINNTASQNASSGVKGIVASEVLPPAVPGKTGAVMLGGVDLTTGDWHHHAGKKTAGFLSHLYI
jgi:hypothetical protein